MISAEVQPELASSISFDWIASSELDAETAALMATPFLLLGGYLVGKSILASWRRTADRNADALAMQGLDPKDPSVFPQD